MIRYYMDEHVNPEISGGLRDRGIDVLTIEEDGAKGTPDLLLLERATSLGRVLFTMDRDFLIEGTRRQKEGVFFEGIVYIEQNRHRIGQCIDDLELVALIHEHEGLQNTIFYLPL